MLASVSTSTLRWKSSSSSCPRPTRSKSELSVVLHFDQQINVAIEPVFASRDRTEYANVPRAVASGDAEDLLAIAFNGHGSALE